MPQFVELAAYEALQKQNEGLRELLRRHVIDWGGCDNPESCACSHAQALRSLVAHLDGSPDGRS